MKRLVPIAFLGTALVALGGEVVRSNYIDPFPALLLPSFAASPDDGETYTLNRGVVEATTRDGRKLTTPAVRLTEDAGVLPDAVMKLISFEQLRADGTAPAFVPRSAIGRKIVGHRPGRTPSDDAAVIDDPETTDFLRERVERALDRDDIVQARVLWHRMQFDRDSEKLVSDDIIKNVALFPR